MKKYLILGLALLAPVLNVLAGGTEEFRVNGLQVILRESPKDVISARLFVRGGTANYAKDKAGVEALALSLAMNGGTESMDKVAFKTAAEQIGTSFGSGSTYDFSNVSMTCIKAFWDESWTLFADAIMNPAFSEQEFGLMQQQMITAAKGMESDPDSHLRNIAMVNAFGEDHPYSIQSDGNPESLEGLSLSDVKSHYASIMGKKNVFLVVVGNVDAKDLKAKIEASLAKLPMGDNPKKIPLKPITEDSHTIEHRDIATNYIRGLMSGPLKTSPDAVVMQVAMNILGDRYFEELRTKRSLSYAPAAFFASGVMANPYSVIYISTLDPKQSMQVMVDEINSVKSQGFEASELTNTKQTFLTYHYMGLETSSSQSNSLGMAEISGDWEMAETFTDKVNAITLKDLNRVFDMYTKAIAWTYLGKQEDVKADDFTKTVDVPAKNKPY
jgi:predicted Zn-dependent peptidase